ncbi:VOC family protein [Caballeronia sp. LZ001]|uniref:VOC family protein n=1 Tax=Caballeronia sp. LZ001 TaxID=3038553 RepID=UPI00285BC325|nr:VOC family protein [Caballeronia sp. LZ001]MDR5804861.1 VOC family protein [Caballeronia sp. LZ001]
MKSTQLVKRVTQVGLVVRDLDAALREYADKLGIGPWRVYTYAPPKLTDTKVRGVPVPFSMKLALAVTQDTMWELIQPLDGPSIYAEFLREHGEGIHHVMVDTGRTRGDVTKEFLERGWHSIMEGKFLGAQFEYYGTEASLATTIEVCYLPSDWTRPEPDYWYPSNPQPSAEGRE